MSLRRFLHSLLLGCPACGARWHHAAFCLWSRRWKSMPRTDAGKTIDEDVLREALDNLFEREWGDKAKRGTTTVAGAYAKDIAAEYVRLVADRGAR